MQIDFKKILLALIGWSIITILLFMATSCSDSRRLMRIQKRSPFLFDKANDTIVLHDTTHVMIPGVKIDTSASLNKLRRDTLVINNKTLHVKTWIHRDTLYLNSKQDTIRETRYKEIKVPYIKYKTQKIDKPFPWIWLFIALSIISICVVIIVKKRNR